MPSFATRSQEPELMDDLTLGGETMNRTLQQLAVVNRFLAGTPLRRGLKKLLKRKLPLTGHPITVADLGCGGGEALVDLATWARKQALDIQFIGFDANPHVIAYARKQAIDYPEVSFEVADVTHTDFLQRRFDVMMCSLFLHHFSTQTLQHLLPAYLKMCQRGLVLSDLQRHWLPWYLFAAVTWVLGAAPMIRHDGLLSIQRAFTRKELHALLKPHVAQYSLQWRWAFRYLGVVETISR